MKTKMPIVIWILSSLWILLSIGATYSGITMLIDPSGKDHGLDQLLQYLPIDNLLIPALFLLLLQGLTPFFLSLEVWLISANKQFILPDEVWWILGIIVSCSILFWGASQLLFGLNPFFHIAYIAIGLTIGFLMITKSTRNFFFHW